MLSVRLPQHLETRLNAYCQEHTVTKSHAVQEALSAWLTAAQEEARARSAGQEPDLSFLAPDDPIRPFIGIAKGGMSTDELMRMTRGDDWNKP